MAHSGEIEKLERRWMDNPTGLTFAPLAEAYRRAGDHPRALEVLELGLAQHPAYVPALIVRARCHLDARLDGEAETSFHAVLSSDPHNLIALKGLADLYELTERLPDAVGFLNRLLEADPTHADAAIQRNRIAVLIGERDAAHGAPAPAPAPVSVAGADQSDRAAPEGTAPETLLVSLDPDPAAELEAVEAGEFERSSEFDPAPIAPEHSDPAETPEDALVGSDAGASNPLEGFEPGSWDLPFDAVTPSAQPFDEHLGVEAMEAAPAAEEGSIVLEEADTDEGEQSELEPVLDLDGEEPSPPWIAAEAAGADPVKWNPAVWGHEAAVPPSEATEADPGPALGEGDPRSQPLLDEDASTFSAEAAGDEGEGMGGVTPPSVADPVVERSVYLGAVHEAMDSPDAATAPMLEGGEAAPAPQEEPPIPTTLVAEPSPEPVEVPFRDLRLESESYLDMEHGWLSSTDWSASETEASPAIAETEPAGMVVASESPDTAAPEPETANEDAVMAESPSGENFASAVVEADEDPAEAVTLVEGAFLEEPETVEPAPEIEPELVITETMAEVFLRQGHRPLALAVYAQLLERDPGNSRLQVAISRLRGELLGERGPAASAGRDAGAGSEEPVGSFLARVLGPAEDEPDTSPAPPVSVEPLGGRPTRAAEDPALSLSTIFGEDARRQGVVVSGADGTSQDGEPSFDEFFGANSVPAGAGGDEAELEQFNAWLRSLQR